MGPEAFRRLLRKLAESTTDVIYMFSADWEEVVFVNEAYEEIFGRSIEALHADAGDFLMGIHPDDRERVEAAMERVTAGESVELEYRVNPGDDFERWAWARAEPITDADGSVNWVGGYVREVTERREHAEELDRAREQLRQVIDLVPDLIFAKNADGEFILANEAVADAYDVEIEEIEGKTDHELHDVDEEASQFRADDREVLESGESKFIPEEELTDATGETLILQTTKIPFDVAGTEEQAVLGYARDVTDLKEYERELEAQRDRLELLNEVVRHDIRNDMQMVRGRAELLADHVDEAGQEHVDELVRAATEAIDRTKTARDLTQTMLRSEEALEAVPLDRVLGRRVDAIRSRYGDAEIDVERPLPDATVMADDLLASVLDNLLKNAIVHNDAEDPHVTVSAECERDRAILRVADDGPGIPDDRRDAVFGRGEKGLDSAGTGLGLHLVDTIVDHYGGDVRVTGNDPEGSVFVVELPVAAGE